MTGRLEPLADGVWAWTGAGSNVGVVVGDDGITLIDAGSAPSLAIALASELERFDRPVRHVVHTSSHLDSVGGSMVWSLAARYGRRWTEAMLAQPPPVDAYRRLRPEFADEYADEAYTTRPVSHVVDAAAWLTDRVLAVPVRGQQAENLVVLVPSAGVLFAGAFATIGTTPNAWDGDPAVWADTLGELAAELGPDGVVVPGSGPIGRSSHLGLLQAYLYACDDATGDPRRIPDGPWDDWTDRDLDAVNVERAAMLARGVDGVPRTMLRRLGIVIDERNDR